MRPLRPSWFSALAILVLVAGCTHPLKPSPTSSVPDPTPNFTGDWSKLPGDLSLARVRTSVFEHDAATNASVARTAACRYPYTHKIDTANRTIYVAKDRLALHPYDPGQLRVLFSHELAWDRPACVIPALYGVNANGTSPTVCLWGLPTAELKVKVPWRCHLPVEPFNDATAHVWTNVSITLEDGTPAGYSIDVNGHHVAGGANATWTTWVMDAKRPLLHEVRIEVQSLGRWPLASVRRT